MTTVIKWLRWLLRAMLFLFLFALAIKNSDVVTLRFFFGKAWLAPLAVVLLVAFVSGVAVGLLATLGNALRRESRRDLPPE